jgi:hypothetical protein
MPCSEVPFLLSRLSRSRRLFHNFCKQSLFQILWKPGKRFSSGYQVTDRRQNYFSGTTNYPWRVKEAKLSLSTELGVDVQLYTFLTSALGEGEWWTSHPRPFTPVQECRYQFSRRLGSLVAGVDVFGGWKISCLWPYSRIPWIILLKIICNVDFNWYSVTVKHNYISCVMSAACTRTFSIVTKALKTHTTFLKQTASFRWNRQS